MPNSNAKGGKNERGVAKLLTRWTGFEFARVPQSGGLGWQNRMQITGDVIPTDPADMVTFPFSVEAKFYKEIDFEAPLLGNNVKWIDWWNQADRDAERAEKLPIVFMRRNLMPKDEHYIIVSLDTFDIFTGIDGFNNPYGYFIYNDDIVILPSRDLLRAPYANIEKGLRRLWKGSTL